MTAPSTTTAAQARIFSPATRALTIGILLGVTMVAFESLAVVTVAPLFTADLGGAEFYGWVFSGLLLASLVGAVVAGEMADAGSLLRPLLGGLVVFGAGLVVSGVAGAMVTMIAGRVLQGLGVGAVTTVMYAAITRAYPDSIRARLMALLSSAWIVPGLLGPTVAGLVAETWHWRWVFWGVVPFILVVAALTVRPFASLPPPTAAGAARVNGGRMPALAALAAGAGLFVYGVGVESPWLAAALAVPGAALTVVGLRTLLPGGALVLRRGLPAAVAGRGTLFAAFIGVEAFLALMLTAVHGYSTAVTGMVIATGAIAWAAGSWLQSRLDERGAVTRGPRMVAGAALLVAGIGLQMLALHVTVAPLVVVVAGWVIAGLGIGMAHATASVLALALAPAGEEGSVSAALQIGDQVAGAVSTGVGGALFALAARQGWGDQRGILLAFLFVLLPAVVALAAAARATLVAPEGSEGERRSARGGR